MPSNDIQIFSLVEGGVTHHLFQQFAKKRPEQLFHRTAVVCALICWLPLLILSVIEGVAWGDKVTIPFLYDIAAYTRFLIAVPLLVMAESMIGPRLAQVAKHFMLSGRVKEADFLAYTNAIEEGIKLRDSKWAEAIVIVIAYISAAVSLITFAPTVSTWRWTGTNYTLAAWWYALIAIPIFQFLLFRWFLRMFNWSRFLYRMSRLDLKLMPTHPDRAGGIAFVGSTQRFFAIILFAVGSVFAGIFGNEIIYENLSIQAIRIPVGSLTVLLVFLIQLPGLFFFFALRSTKRRGIFEYGDLALQYTSEFDGKWIGGKRPPGEELMGSGDIQSLADLGNSYSVIQDMKIVPFAFKTTLWLAAAFIFPMLPLLLTVMPLEEIVKTVFKVLA